MSHCCQSYLKLTISYILSLTFKAFIIDPSYDLNLFEVYFLNYYMSEILHKIFYTGARKNDISLISIMFRSLCNDSEEYNLKASIHVCNMDL